MASKKKDELAESYNQVRNQLSEMEKNKPGEYQGKYTGQIQSMLDKIMNREKFNYDMNADPLYQQYKGQYTALGQNAMRDTVGNAAALTGGYASTSAVSAGQQAYNQYLQQLSNIVPELYNAAYNRYQAEGNDLYNQIGVLQNLDSNDYGRYRDTVSDYYNNLNYYGNKENTLYNRDYTLGRDEVSDSQWERQFAEQQKQREAAEKASKESASSDAESKAKQQEFENSLAIAKILQASGASSEEINSYLQRAASGSGNGTLISDTTNTKQFRAAMMTPGEFSRRSTTKSKYGSYDNYIKSFLSDWYNQNKLSNEEFAFLLHYYGL